MAKGYSFSDIEKPGSPSASAVSGGTLTASTTYYYRIIRVSDTGGVPYTWKGKSQVSDEFSVTTDSTNKTARITFQITDGLNYAYRIWRSTTSGGMINAVVNCLAFYPKDVDYRSGTTVTFDDTGYAATAGNVYCETFNDAHGILTLSGSTSSDKFSIVDLYNADVAAGWGVINKIGGNAYRVNCYLIGHSSMYWFDQAKTIILADGADFNITGVNVTFGVLSGTNLTKNGCNIIVESPWLCSIVFPTLYAYRTTFSYLVSFNMTPNYNYVGGGFNAGVVQDCAVDYWRNFAPYGSGSCTLKNFICSNFDNSFSNYAAVYDGVRMLTGSRLWQITSGGINLTARKVYSESAYLVLITSAASTSSLTVVDSQYANVTSAATSTPGFLVYDKYSFNLKTTDENGNAISGASVKVYDVNDTLVVDTTTDANGVITEQEITRILYTQIEGTGYGKYTTATKTPHTIIIQKSGYETYRCEINPTVSEAQDLTIALKTASIQTDQEMAIQI